MPFCGRRLFGEWSNTNSWQGVVKSNRKEHQRAYHGARGYAGNDDDRTGHAMAILRKCPERGLARCRAARSDRVSRKHRGKRQPEGFPANRVPGGGQRPEVSDKCQPLPAVGNCNARAAPEPNGPVCHRSREAARPGAPLCRGRAGLPTRASLGCLLQVMCRKWDRAAAVDCGAVR